LDDEIVNTAQGVAKFENMVEQQIRISNAQNADCGNDVRHRYCNTMFWFKCKGVIEASTESWRGLAFMRPSL